jgi:hypothetical protein
MRRLTLTALALAVAVAVAPAATAKGKKTPPPPPPSETVTVSGDVTAFLYGPRGELNGFLVDGGGSTWTVRFPPDQATRSTRRSTSAPA